MNTKPEPEAPALPAATAPSPPTLATMLPLVTIEGPHADEPRLTRRGVLQAKLNFKKEREDTFSETRGLPPSPEKSALYKRVQACVDEESDLETCLQERFVPQHSPTQFLSPRAFFVSPLFRVCSKAQPRAIHLEMELPSAPGRPPLRYSGPELRQPDGRVFLALVHMLRDVQVGTNVRFQPDQVCQALFHRYDGNSRNLLRSHIQRLQHGVVISTHFSVQLCLGFDYPRLGGWTVALDPKIVQLFRISPEVWFPMQPRLQLGDGLATWLYAFVESQTRLIPMRITRLRELCGSDSGERAFTNSLRLALQRVADTGLIDTGWSLRRGEVRWLKRARQST
jgi:hypothetical protein